MEEIYQEIRQETRRFRNHWAAYLTLFISVDLLIQLVVIPLFRLVTTWVLQAGEIPFVSYQNVVAIVSHHPLVIVALAVELVALLVVVYGQFALALLGVRDISRGIFSIRMLQHEIQACFRRLRPGSLGILLVYFLLVIPFADLVFRTPLLAKVQIPQFILDYMTRNGILLTILVLFYIVIVFMGIRCILALPLMVYQGQQPRRAFANSWRITQRKRWWPLVARLLVLGIIASFAMLVFYAATIGSQWLLDFLPRPWPLFFANFNLLVIQFGSELVTAWAGTVTIDLLFLSRSSPSYNDDSRQLVTKGGRQVLAVAWTLLVLIALVGDGLYLSGSSNRRPVTVSHRGVADENGVQNTIAAMKKTHRLHPDYIEMDLHETKDHQFVVLHDENLKELAGVNKKPSQLTLNQLTHLTVHENGHQAKIASFTDYLRVANHLHQKLLVEIKTTPYDSADMLARFDRLYGADLVHHHDRVHSLDYSVVRRLKYLDPRLYVMYIQPYNFTYPNTVANGYSMEYSTLTYDFITLAHLQGKQVYAWTVNDPAVMKQMMYKNADGIITDNLVELNRAIVSYRDHNSYARQLLNYIMVVPTNTEFAP